MQGPNPCLTCGCHEHESIVERWNQRTRRLITRGCLAESMSEIPADIGARTSEDAVFGFGFDGWLPSTDHDCLVGRFRAAIRKYAGRNDFRYYYVDILMPGEVPVVVEHQRGERLRLRKIGYPNGLVDFKIIDEMSDEEFGALLLYTHRALVRGVVAIEREYARRTIPPREPVVTVQHVTYALPGSAYDGRERQSEARIEVHVEAPSELAVNKRVLAVKECIEEEIRELFASVAHKQRVLKASLSRGMEGKDIEIGDPFLYCRMEESFTRLKYGSIHPARGEVSPRTFAQIIEQYPVTRLAGAPDMLLFNSVIVRSESGVPDGHVRWYYGWIGPNPPENINA